MEYDYFFDGFEGPSVNKTDRAEYYIMHPLPLLKILIHARNGIPLEVMGLMLGEKINSYCMTLLDVFAMPQSASGVTVEAVDPVFQADMFDLLKVTGRPELSIGWYHSHPGFGCWLSSTDIATQSEYEKLDSRALAVVVDPIQSRKGNVVIDAFRVIQNLMISEYEVCYSSSNSAFLNVPSISAYLHGCDRNFYSVRTEYTACELEKKLLRLINQNDWIEVLHIRNINYQLQEKQFEKKLTEILDEKVKKQKEKLKEEEIKADYEIEMLEKKESKKDLDFVDEALNEIKAKPVKKELKEIGRKLSLNEISKIFLKKAIDRQIMVNIHKTILGIKN